MDYKYWVDRRWRIAKVADGVDFEEGDELHFELDTASPPKLRLAEIVCPHLGSHGGLPWKNVFCNGLGNSVVGTTVATRENFKIDNLLVGDLQVLSCGPAAPRTGDEGAGSTSGGVCWTAEDGGRRI